MEIEIKMLSVEEYLIKVRQYLKNNIILKKLIHGKSNNDTNNFSLIKIMTKSVQYIQSVIT